jgi:putative spermidine/putrescine transport system substrate-binding protein
MNPRAGLGLRCGMLILFISMITAAAAEPSQGQQGRIVVASFGGAWERDLRAAMIDSFEQAYSVKVEYVVGLSSEQLARLKAQKDNPQIDVVMMDDLLTAEAASLGLVEKLSQAEIPNMRQLRKEARIAGDYGVGFTFSATVLMYNTERIRSAPTSWRVLWDPQYAGRVGLPHINTIWGLHTLLMANKLESGGEFNAQAGLTALRRMARENQAVVYTSTTQLNTLAQQGQVWFAPFSSVWVNQLQDGGAPVAIAVPQEGVYPIWTVWSLTKGAKNRALALKFLNYSIRREVQERFAPRALAMPANAATYVSADLARRVKFDRLLPIDAEAVAKQRTAWIEEWNRAILGR